MATPAWRFTALACPVWGLLFYEQPELRKSAQETSAQRRLVPMMLYLIRHAIAEDRAPGGRDEERALTPAGKQKMARATEGLRKLKIRPDLILTSPLRRAYETAEIVARGLGGLKTKILPELAPGTDPVSIVGALRIYRHLKTLALVGHQPGLGNFATLILTGSSSGLELDLKKGGVACIETTRSRGGRAGVLLWLATPKLLRSI